MTATEVIAPEATLIAIREVTRLLSELHESEFGVSAYGYAGDLEKATASLEQMQFSADSPVGALCRLLRDDRALRHSIRLRCYGEAGV